MGIPILIIGASGSGKSASLRNFSSDEVGIFNVAGKPLPFRNKLPLESKCSYDNIISKLKENTLKTYVIDDSQYLMSFELLRNAKVPGYQKYTDIGLNFANLVRAVIGCTSNDTLVYFLHHLERADDGYIKAKTVGKLLDNWFTLEGFFSIVLLAEIHRNGKHVFVTQSDGYTTAKSPMDMFPLEIDNDLKVVDTAIRDYYFNERKE